MKIVVLDGYTLNPGDLSWKELEKLGECSIYERTSADKVPERADKAGAVLTNKVAFDRETLACLPDLQYIGVLATGTNVIDFEATREAGITVTNIPAYSTESVAQMVFSHLLHFVQNISVHAASVKAGEWAKSPDFSYHLTFQTELAGKTLGIIGFGRIGQAVARIGQAFGMKIIFNNRSEKEPLPGSRQTDLDALLAESDFISINCPLTDENAGFINKAAIEKMKPGAFLVNTGRGQLINEHDLAEALNSGRIAGAGLDVLASEPPSPANPLMTARNCNITPHMAWATLEARQRLMRIAVENLKAFLSGEPQNVVS